MCSYNKTLRELSELLTNVTAEITTVSVDGQRFLDEAKDEAKRSGVPDAEMTELSRAARNNTAE